MKKKLEGTLNPSAYHGHIQHSVESTFLDRFYLSIVKNLFLQLSSPFPAAWKFASCLKAASGSRKWFFLMVRFFYYYIICNLLYVYNSCEGQPVIFLRFQQTRKVVALYNYIYFVLRRSKSLKIAAKKGTASFKDGCNYYQGVLFLNQSVVDESRNKTERNDDSFVFSLVRASSISLSVLRKFLEASA